MVGFLNSVRSPQEATAIYQKVEECLSKGGSNLTKLLASDNANKRSQRQTGKKNCDTFEAELQ